MIFNTKFVLLSFIAIVAAQSTATGASPSTTGSGATPTPSGLDDCIMGCVKPLAVANGCGSFANLSCVCTNTQFQTAALTCITAVCTDEDVTNVGLILTQECASVTGSASAGGSAPPTTGASASGTGATAPASTTNAATGTVGSMRGLAAGFVGALAAAAL